MTLRMVGGLVSSVCVLVGCGSSDYRLGGSNNKVGTTSAGGSSGDAGLSSATGGSSGTSGSSGTGSASCTDDMQCTDYVACNGSEVCGADHTCHAGTPVPNGTACDQNSVCQDGVCVSADGAVTGGAAGTGGSGGSGFGGVGGTSPCMNPVGCYETCTCVAGRSPITCVQLCTTFNCGNGIIEGGEQCDGTAFNGETCGTATMGAKPGGTLKCSSCFLDTTSCTSGAVCSSFGDSPGCQLCLDAYCCGEVKSCYTDPQCAALVQCAGGCPDPNNSSDPCVQKCAVGLSSTAISAWNTAVLCMANSCLCNHL